MRDVDEPWLSDAEARAWRSWIDATWRVERSIADQLRRYGLTHNEYAILVLLSESPERRARMTRIAHVAQIPKTRLTHQIDRMVGRGLVERENVVDDARGIAVRLTDAGDELLRSAAQGHAQVVRRAVFDALSAEDVETLAVLMHRIAAGSATSDES